MVLYDYTLHCIKNVLGYADRLRSQVLILQPDLRQGFVKS